MDEKPTPKMRPSTERSPEMKIHLISATSVTATDLPCCVLVFNPLRFSVQSFIALLARRQFVTKKNKIHVYQSAMTSGHCHLDTMIFMRIQNCPACYSFKFGAILTLHVISAEFGIARSLPMSATLLILTECHEPTAVL